MGTMCMQFFGRLRNIVNVILVAATVVAALAVGTFGCVTARYKNFEGVQMGMEKDQVLQEAGAPDVSRRWQGKDRWIYRMPKNNDFVVKEVHFQDGKVIYIGDPPVPEVSAEEQDIRNERYNQQADAVDTRERQREADREDEVFNGRRVDESKKVVPQWEPVK